MINKLYTDRTIRYIKLVKMRKENNAILVSGAHSQKAATI